MKATVREYTVKKRVVVIEIDEEEAKKIAELEVSAGGYTLTDCGRALLVAVGDALDADRAAKQEEAEDVPF